MVAPIMLDGPINGASFTVYVTQALIPTVGETRQRLQGHRLSIAPYPLEYKRGAPVAKRALPAIWFSLEVEFIDVRSVEFRKFRLGVHHVLRPDGDRSEVRDVKLL